MIRLRSICTVKYGHYKEALQNREELNAVCKSRGWSTATFLAPIAGTDNELVAEYDFPDLATAQKEMDAQMSDPEFMKVFRGGADLIYPQSSRTELYETAPHLV